MKTKSNGKLKRPKASPALTGSTRSQLLQWALGPISTEHLRRLKAGGKDVMQLFAELRQEKFHFEFALERLQKDHEGLRGGHKRWREEAVMLHRVRETLEAFINKEMKMTAKDPRLKRLARQIEKVSNDAGTQRPGSPDGSLATETRKPGSLK